MQLKVSRNSVILGLFLSLTLWSCQSNGKLTFFGKLWHNTTGRYNAYFNGREKWNEALLGLERAHPENFRELLDIYNWGPENIMKGTAGTMDEILKKCSKVIDKHPKSKWVDDCYLLMGKAYFLKADFYAAIDHFQYVFSNSKDPVLKAESQVWVGKSYLFLNRISDAEGILLLLQNDKNFPPKAKQSFEVFAAAVHLQRGKLGLAAKNLEAALPLTRKKDDRVRYHYILGQIYQRLNKSAEAAEHYGKVGRMNPDYRFAFNARLNQVFALSQNASTKKATRGILKKMLRDDKNIEYYDQIYYNLGRIEQEDRNNSLAITYYNQSIRSTKGNQQQLSSSYMSLGNLHFAEGNYEAAKNYFDSATFTAGQGGSPELDAMVKRNTVLADLVDQLIIIKKQDSLIRLSLMDKGELDRAIDRMIAADKKKQDQAAKQAAQAGSGGGGIGGGITNPFPGNPGMGGGSGTASSFPFYNAASRSRGYNDFIKYWGNRPLKDYWRLKSKLQAMPQGTPGPGGATTGTDTAASNTGTKDPGISDSDPRSRYYQDIPKNDADRNEAKKKIAVAMFRAGEIYLDNLNEPAKAAAMFNDLLKNYPGNENEAKTHYYLARIYRQQKNQASADEQLAVLKQNFPRSTYIRILEKEWYGKEGDAVAVKDSALAESEYLYSLAVEAYKKGAYSDVKRIKEQHDTKFAGNTLQSRFDYLLALCLVKTGKLEDAVKSLKAITEDYPGTEVALSADDIMQAILKKQVKTSDSSSQPATRIFGLNLTDQPCYLLILNRGADLNRLRNALSDFNNNNHSLEALQIGNSVVIGEKYALIISGFADLKAAKNYFSELHPNDLFFNSLDILEKADAIISKQDYILLTSNGMTDQYLKEFTQYGGI